MKKTKARFNLDKYLKSIREILMDNYGIDKDSAMDAIKNSGLLDSLRISAELTAHISEEVWAEKIWMGYKKKTIQRKMRKDRCDKHK